MKHLLWITIVFIAIITGCKKDDQRSLATVSTATASNITSNSAQSGGSITVTGGTAISQSGICWATHNNPSISDSIISSGATGTGAFTSALTNLNANTEYYVRAFAINGSGTAYGNTDSFQTAKGLPTVSTTVISNVAPLSAHSGGTVTNEGGVAVTARGICWSTSVHPTTANLKTSDSSGLGVFTDSLTSLASQTVYYVRAYATNSYGTAYGNEISFTASSANTVLDVDGNVYSYVVIGTQTWMGSNLKVTHYQNGDAIVNGLTTNFDWWGNILNSLYVGAYTYPNGDSANTNTYGLLYNCYVVDDNRGVCPAGWHIPTDGEWATMLMYEGMSASEADTSQLFYTGTIAPKLLVGGSSGLNLQMAGELTISPTGGSLGAFLTAGLYTTSSEDASLPRIGNFLRVFDPTDPANTSGVGISNTSGFFYATSLRCIKN